MGFGKLKNKGLKYQRTFVFFDEPHFKGHIIGKEYCSRCKKKKHLLDQRENESCVVGWQPQGIDHINEY